MNSHSKKTANIVGAFYISKLDSTMLCLHSE